MLLARLKRLMKFQKLSETIEKSEWGLKGTIKIVENIHHAPTYRYNRTYI